jgi:hypothetical protein
MKFVVRVFFEKHVEKTVVSLKSDNNNGYFTLRPEHSFIISRSVLLRMRNASGKRCRENRNTFYIQFFFEYRTVYEIMWKNIIEPDWPQMTIWRMRIPCWVPKAKYTLGICNIYCFPTANSVALTRLNAVVYLHSLSC